MTAYIRGRDSVSFTSYEMVTFGFTWMALFYACLLLIVATAPGWPMARLFRNRVLRHFGLIAYGMFLMHMAVDAIAHGVLLGKSTEIRNVADLAVTAIAFVVTWFLATLSWKFFEQPIIRWGHSFRYGSKDKVSAAKPGLAASQLLN